MPPLHGNGLTTFSLYVLLYMSRVSSLNSEGFLLTTNKIENDRSLQFCFVSSKFKCVRQ
jgi:hypothetical protein